MGFNNGLIVELPGTTSGGGEWNGDTTLNTFTDGDTTPDVTSGMVFVTANTSTTVITNLDHDDSTKQITILIGDDYTSFAHDTAKLWLEDTPNLSTQSGDTLKFLFDGTRWRLTDISLVYH